MTSIQFGYARRVLACVLAGVLSVGWSVQGTAADELQQCRTALDSCRYSQAKTFLTVIIQWPTVGHDVDLHVIDAARSEFFYGARTVPGRPGELSIDTQQGPGVEVWEISEAPPGEYRVLYNLFDAHGNPDAAIVAGSVYHRGGSYRFGNRSVIETGRANALPVAVVTVGDDGSVEVSEL